LKLLKILVAQKRLKFFFEIFISLSPSLFLFSHILFLSNILNFNKLFIYLHVPKAVVCVESKKSGWHCKNPNDQNGDFKTHFGKKKILSFHLPGVPDISQYQEKDDR
jgi:hypothetical protein